MKVLKFGGTSVGSADAIRRITEIIKSQEEQIVAVFSAMSGVTNMLERCLELAADKNGGYVSLVREIETKHREVAGQLLSHVMARDVMSRITSRTAELEKILDGISCVGERTLRSSDLVLGFGEILSIELIISVMAAHSLNATHVDPGEMVFTRLRNGKETVDAEMTEKAVKEKLGNISGLIITSGYIARSANGYCTTLGRGGSDFTAAIIAGALDASILEIWTDVSGIFTADPRFCDDAYPIREISYAEAMELSHFGARVIYSPTIQPVFRKKIPVLIKNTFSRDDPGTMIKEFPSGNGNIVKAISSVNDVCLVSLAGAGMAGVVGIASRMFTALARENINVILITQASSEQSICIAIDNNSGEKACGILNDEFVYEIQAGRVRKAILEKDFSIVAMVGEGMKHSVGIAGQAFSALGRNGINIHAIAQGSSELNVSVVVRNKDCRKSIDLIHQEFFHSVNRTINLFIIGTGKVGSALISQIISQSEFLLSSCQADLRIAGIANSRRMMILKQGIRGKNWKELLDSGGRKMNLKQFTSEMFELNLPNSIFIDNTASESVSRVYEDILSKSISVVTCNKIAASSSYEYYSGLKMTAVRKRVHFRFESNVGAGLPIIQTISNLVRTGDQIHKIEAVVSGSLNYIFNSFCNGMLFSDAVLDAMHEGFTEPDPLVDLRGTDVARKLLILVREAGIRLEASDISFDSYLPSPLPGTYDAGLFPGQIKKYDDYFESRRKDIIANNLKMRIVACYEGTRAYISLMEVDSTHPFYNLEGNDNVVSVLSKRYLSRPLIIKGAGAGADVTASGVFSDILSIINS